MSNATAEQPMTELKVGDKVYKNVTYPKGWEYGRIYTIQKIRTAPATSRYSGDVKLYYTEKKGGSGETRNRFIHPDDLTPEQAQAMADLRAKEARAEYEAKDRSARVRESHKAFKLANPIPAEPVRTGGLVVEVGKESGEVKAPFVDYRYDVDRQDRISIRESDWSTVRVTFRRDYRTNAVEFSTSGRSDLNAEQLTALAECIAKAVEVSESLPLRDTRVWGTDE